MRNRPGHRSQTLCASIAFVLLWTAARGDQLPAPPSIHEQQCALIFQGIENNLYRNRDFLYDTQGVRDRDELAKRMVSLGTPGLVRNLEELCPDDARNFPAAALLALAHKIIAERFGTPK
jgi:hypothetical protein